MLLPTLLLSAFPMPQVDLVLGPGSQNAPVCSTVEITLTAKAGTFPPVQEFTAIDAILSWDPAKLEFINANAGAFPWFVSGFLADPDGINLDILDGEALYTVLSSPGAPASVPPDIEVVTFTFTVLEAGGKVELVPAVGVFGTTRVLSTVPGAEITGDISAVAKVRSKVSKASTGAPNVPTSVPLSDPLELFLLGASIAATGALLLGRRESLG